MISFYIHPSVNSIYLFALKVTTVKTLTNRQCPEKSPKERPLKRRGASGWRSRGSLLHRHRHGRAWATKWEAHPQGSHPTEETIETKGFETFVVAHGLATKSSSCDRTGCGLYNSFNMLYTVQSAPVSPFLKRPVLGYRRRTPVVGVDMSWSSASMMRIIEKFNRMWSMTSLKNTSRGFWVPALLQEKGALSKSQQVK